jgi:hypothetical protein
MSHSIVQGFLGDTVEAECDFGGNAFRQVVGLEFNGDGMAFLHLAAKIFQRCLETEILELRGMKRVRQQANIFCQAVYGGVETRYTCAVDEASACGFIFLGGNLIPQEG